MRTNRISTSSCTVSFSWERNIIGESVLSVATRIGPRRSCGDVPFLDRNAVGFYTFCIHNLHITSPARSARLLYSLVPNLLHWLRPSVTLFDWIIFVTKKIILFLLGKEIIVFKKNTSSQNLTGEQSCQVFINIIFIYSPILPKMFCLYF